MVTKKIRTMSALLALTMGITLVTGCGKKKDSVKVEDMIEKYSAYCELGEYKNIEYEKTELVVTDDTVRYQIDSMISQYSSTETVEEGIVEDGDTVNIDFVGSVDGVEFSGGSTEGAGYDLTIGSETLLPELENQLIGHSVGESFDVTITFPDDYMDEDDLEEGDISLNGKEAVFAVTINSKQLVTEPEYNDEFIASNTDYSSVEEYEAAVKENLEESYANSNDNSNKSAIIAIVEENSTINEYPEQELEQLIDDAINSVTENAANYGYDLGTFVQSVYGFSSEDSFREYVADLAESYIREKILICAIAKAEGMTITSDEKQEEIELMISELGVEDEDELYEYYDEDDVLYYALSEKVYDFLLDNAIGVEATETDAEEATETDATVSDAEEASSTDAASVTDADIVFYE